MHLVFASERGEFHAHERLKGNDCELSIAGPNAFSNFRCRRLVFGSDFFAGKDDMHGISQFRLGAVEKRIHAGYMTPNESS